jgi:putative transposase
MRKDALVENEYYHVYNRGVDKRDVFLSEKDFERFLLAMDLLNDTKDGLMIRWRDYKENHPKASIQKFVDTSIKQRNPLVEIVAYCLNSNHYHLILKQTNNNKSGIRLFMQRLGNSYTKYFNEKNQRSGALFQGRFKSSLISPNNFLRMSVYVNCNCEIHSIQSAMSYKWCSFAECVNSENKRIHLCRNNAVLDQFRSNRDYANFAIENIRDFRDRKQDENIYLE